MERRGWTVAFVGVLVAGALFVVYTCGALPERVASHFGAGGSADGFQSRDAYLAWMLAFALGFPILIVGAVGGLPRVAPQLVNLPNRDYWLASERREATLDYLVRQALVLGCVIVVFVCVMHWLIVEANRTEPPRLAMASFLAWLGAFLALMIVWSVRLVRRLRVVL